MLAPLIAPIREPQIGGVATFLTDLALGLAGAGVEVTLYAPSGSHLDGVTVVDTGVDASELRDTLFRPLAPGGASGEGLRRSSAAFQLAYRLIARGGHDLVHNHAFDAPAVRLAGTAGVPVLHTLHLPPDPLVAAALRDVAAGASPPAVAAVSAGQRRAWEAAGVAVDHLLAPGIPTARIPWSATSGPSLLFAGRLSPEKGVLEAIAIARGAGRELVIAGPRYDGAYAEEVDAAARSTGGVTIIGALSRTDLWEQMARSAALVFPIRWQEPFGLVTAEAQAAGCPVIGFRGGALAQVVADGVTGAVVEPGDIEGARQAVASLPRYSRGACRARAERLFDLAPVIAAHLALYEQLPSGCRDPSEVRQAPRLC